MTGVSGCGSWPGTDPLAVQQVVLGELAQTPEGVQGHPFLVRPAGRGPTGSALAQALALLVDLPAQIGPHGWALADRPGRDLARAASAVREDLDALAVAGHGYTGPLVVPVLGPLSLAARVWLARGDRGVSDPGALRELVQSSASGLAEHLAAVARAVPGAQVSVLVVEPQLSDVVGGRIPTFSGRDLLRSVASSVAAEHLATVVRSVRTAGAEQVVLHVGAQSAVVEIAAGAGADGFGLAPSGVGDWELVADLVERGLRLWVPVDGGGAGDGGGPASGGDGPADVSLTDGGPAGLARAVAVPWGRLGLPAAELDDVVLLVPDQGGAPTPADARRALSRAIGVARVLAERAAG
ncbi:MAG: hypothetical protein L6311_05775 [Cellulomonas sp.]|nr:hypothetical protein [Cellulomonas sp.]